MFVRLETAFWVFALVGGIRGFHRLGLADRAWAEQVVEYFIVKLGSVNLGLIDDVTGEFDDLVHKLRACEFALLHLMQLAFPVACHGRGGEGFDAEFFGEVDQGQSLSGDEDFTAITFDVFLANESFNGGGAGGGRSEASLGHGLAEFVVVDEFAGTLHGGE